MICQINGGLTFFVYYFNWFFLRLIITCRLWVIYVREDNYSNVKVMIKRLIWTIWTPMSSVLKKADKLNLSLSLSQWGIWGYQTQIAKIPGLAFIRLLSDILKWNQLLINGGYQSDFAVWKWFLKFHKISTISPKGVWSVNLDSYERAINV